MALQKIVLVSVQAILRNDLTKDHPAHGGRSQAIASEPDPQSLGCSHSVLPRGWGSPGRKRSTSPALQEHSADRQHEKYLENSTKHRIPGLESHWEMLELEMIDLSVMSRQLFFFKYPNHPHFGKKFFEGTKEKREIDRAGRTLAQSHEPQLLGVSAEVCV